MRIGDWADTLNDLIADKDFDMLAIYIERNLQFEVVDTEPEDCEFIQLDNGKYLKEAEIWM